MPTSAILLTEYFTKEAVLYVSLCPHMFLTPEQMFWWDFVRRFDPQPLFKNSNSSSSIYIPHDDESRNWFRRNSNYMLSTNRSEVCSCLWDHTCGNRWLRLCRVYCFMCNFRTLPIFHLNNNSVNGYNQIPPLFIHSSIYKTCFFLLWIVWKKKTFGSFSCSRVCVCIFMQKKTYSNKPWLISIKLHNENKLLHFNTPITLSSLNSLCTQI